MTGESDPNEFDCAGCGQHIWRALPDSMVAPEQRRLCALCITYPDWFKVARLRKILDPNGDVDPKYYA